MKTSNRYFVFLLFLLLFVNTNAQTKSMKNTEIAVFGAGCFWCVEAIFSQLKGVDSVVPGYTGGTVANPTYEEVCTGTTNHAEVAKIVFDPTIISYDELLEVFWKTHNPTTLNQQGADKGTQYRSAIFYTTEEQRKKAEFYKQKLNDEKIWEKPIVTEISPLTTFYPAENYHQDYYKNNPDKGYCKMVIQPKVEKFKHIFPDKIK